MFWVILVYKSEFGASSGYMKSCLKNNRCVECILTLNWKRKTVQAMDCSMDNFKAHTSALGILPSCSLNTVQKTVVGNGKVLIS